jgi:hypothetical protein
MDAQAAALVSDPQQNLSRTTSVAPSKNHLARYTTTGICNRCTTGAERRLSKS